MKPKELHEYTDQEKIEQFNELYSFIREIYDETIENEYPHEDDEHWCYEALIDVLIPTDKIGRSEFWKRFNAIR